MKTSSAKPILLTGATGYIGSHLLRELEARGCTVRCLARQPERVTPSRATTEVVAGDCLDRPSLDAAMTGVDQAFYLVHSMASGASFAALDREAAANFGDAARSAGVRRIIYLGGLADAADSLSTHLKSRVETGAVLRESGVPVVEFRASIVIGAGSLSFEMIRALVERLPAMICPKWVDTRTQPIAIDDVLAYLRAALELKDGREGVFEIGGPEVVSYADMMREYATLRGLRRVLVPVPVLTPRLSGLWLRLVTPAQAGVGRALVEGLRNPTVVRSSAALDTFAVRPVSLREGFVRAMSDGGAAQFKTDSRVAVVDAPPAQAFAPIRRIGGATGWYFATALWRLRGWIDRGFGGIGMPRTRRDPDDCVAGDVIDGWRVEAYEPDRLLRLSAGLRLPGRGWLEFRVEPLDGGSRSLIRQTATFDPKGMAGRLYWYGVLPLHALIFRGLLRRIVQRARPDAAPGDLSLFTYASIIEAPPAVVFRWHEQPGALAALTPAALVRIERQEGGIRDGGRVTVSLGLGPARLRWSLRHHGYVDGRRFCDEQVAGPFAVWRHAHLFEPLGASRTLYEDRIEFAVVRRRAPNRLAAAVLRPLLRVAFAHRHRRVRAAIGHARVGPRWTPGAHLRRAQDRVADDVRPVEAPVHRRMTSSVAAGRIMLLCLVAVFTAGSASAQTSRPGRIDISVEGLNVWQQRNDVRIPPDTGTEFSLVDLAGSSPTPSVRVTATGDITERQQLRFVYAPLRLTGRGTPATPISFAGAAFAVAPTEAVYQFSSYRATWSYRVYEGPTWTWRVGFTGFVRDARIALSQGDRAAEDTDVGFVPLGHVSAEARLTTRWSVGLVLDGSAAPQGRAFDAAATLQYRPAPRWTVFGGYRTIEGGADVDAVYTFAWLNAVVGGVGVRF